MSCWILCGLRSDSSTGGTNGPQGYRFRAQRRILRILSRAQGPSPGATDNGRGKADTGKIDRLICGLRQTKYARELIRTLGGELGFAKLSQLDIHSVFLVSRELGYQTVGQDVHGEMDLLLIVDDETTARTAL